MKWIWFFFVYSLVGFLLEVAFSRATRNPKRDRKCCFLLPLCPVYGLGALFILVLPDGIKQSPWLLLLCGAAAATAAEYLMGLVYERVLYAPFWDYSHLPMSIGGKVCLLFSGIWGLLSLGLVYGVHPAVECLAAHMPAVLFLPAVLVFALDSGFTAYLLRRTRNTDCLRWYAGLSRTRAPAQPAE